MTTVSPLRLVGRVGAGPATPGGRYDVRVTLPDRPGALGEIAAALGRAGADIVSITVVERDKFDAVDDLVVDLPAGTSPDELYSALHTVSGIWVESLHPEVETTGLSGATALLAALVGVRRHDHGYEWTALVDGLPPVLGAAWAALWPASGHDPFVLASPGTPEDPPTGLASISGPTAATAARLWPAASRVHELEIGVVPLGSSYALGVGRPHGPPFRFTELDLLAHIAEIASALLGTPAGAHSSS